MKHVQLYDLVSDRLVMGENVSQAAQFVESGNAQVGFVALAHITSPAIEGKGRYWQIPAEAYPPLEQGLVIISRSRRKKQPPAFVEYINTAESPKHFNPYPFCSPPHPP